MKVLLDTSVLVAAMVEAHPAHEKSLPWLRRGEKQQMHVVGHQAIGVQGNITLARILTQPVEIKAAIVIGKEYRLTIHATLNDVLRNTG